MNGTHAMLSHFPVGFWALATLMILVGSFMTGRLADISRAALLPVLVLSLLGGLAATVIGLIVWPMEANLASPLTRNHMLMSFWSLGIYSMITVLVWQAGASAFDGARRWALVILALIGGLMFSAAGTLGGHLAGASTAFSEVLALMGWKVYTTFYSPLWVVAIMVLIGIALGALGIMSRRKTG